MPFLWRKHWICTTSFLNLCLYESLLVWISFRFQNWFSFRYVHCWLDFHASQGLIKKFKKKVIALNYSLIVFTVRFLLFSFLYHNNLILEFFIFPRFEFIYYTLINILYLTLRRLSFCQIMHTSWTLILRFKLNLHNLFFLTMNPLPLIHHYIF